MADAPIYVHAGAHRTGTTSFQMCLHENRLVLQARGWTPAYPGRDGIKSGKLALRLPTGTRIDPVGAAAKARRTLDPYRTSRPVILSEENILGRMFHFMQGKFYPFAEARCSALRAAWDGPIAHVLLVVRPYEQLFVSAFRKRAEDNPMPDFAEVRDSYLNIDRGWPELAASIRDILRPEAMTVLPYASRGSSLNLLHTLAPGLDMSGLIEPGQIANKSATDAALETLQARYRTGRDLSRADWKSVIERHAANTKPRNFAAFTDKEQADLSARYASDLKQMEWMPAINVA
ncbi:hypothetical protein [uncultured Tateyamaria sp.]|uniref:hypothetical protein n=1 Tax=uncultured Tateyamaria sp. TaxID=455651 RepID=UPI002632A49A|nr:hypothetical protein [uncultured Tateyamaria sp.]